MARGPIDPAADVAADEVLSQDRSGMMPGASSPASNDNPFAAIDPVHGLSPTGEKEEDNPFLSVFGPMAPDTSSTVGAFTGAAVRGVAPTAGGMVGAGAGAAIGAEVGALGGPVAWATVPAGAFLGGLVGFFGGSAATEGAQDWALSQAPDSWKETIGLSERQQRLREQQHPYASFMGGIAPFALTMSPGAFTTKAASLPENATAFQKLMANPVTARVFSGAAMGGMELGQEAWNDQTPDWAKVGIATGFGVVFNKPTQFGEYLHGVGARGYQTIRHPFDIPRQGVLDPAEPTVAQAGDLGVVGPGITESTFRGGEEQSLSSKTTAQNAAADEQSVLGALPEPDVDAVARRIDPEAFQRTDDLIAQRDALRSWIKDQSSPTEDMFADVAARRYAAEEALRNANPNGPAARNFRATLTALGQEEADLTSRRQAWESGQHVDTPDIMLARQHLLDTEHELWDLSPRVASARRHAADYTGVEEAPAAPQPEVQQPAIGAPPETPAAQPEVTGQKTVDQQRAFIIADRVADLVGAGRPRSVAETEARVEAAYYVTLAQRFNGALGTAEDLYRARAARVVGPGQTAPPESTSITRETPKPIKIRTVAEIQAQEKVSATKARRMQDEEILARGRPIETVRFEPAPARVLEPVGPGGAQPEPVTEAPPTPPEPAARPRLRTADAIMREDGIRDPAAVKAVQDQELAALVEHQAQQRAAGIKTAAPRRNRELDRLANAVGVDPTERPATEVAQAIVDRLPHERVVEEINAEAEAGEIEYREAEKAAAEIVPEVVENPDVFYDSGQSRSLEELESEHRPANEVTSAEQRPLGGGEPETAPTSAGQVPEGGGPPGPVAEPGGRAEPEGAAAGSAATAPEPARPEPAAATGAAEPATIEPASAGTEPAGVRPTDSRGNPIFRQSERVIIPDGEALAGRHGEVTEAVGMQWQSIMGGAKSEASYHYQVKTDGGTTVHVTKLDPETGARPSAIPDPVWHGHPIDAAALQRDIAVSTRRASEYVDKSMWARTKKMKDQWKRESANESREVDEKKAVRDAWAAEHPEEAKAIPGYRPPQEPGANETPAATSTEPPSNRSGMSLVETRHTKTGEPLFVVTGGSRVDATEFAGMKVDAKEQGGYWSSYRGGGAVPGWTFKTEAGAKAFMRGAAEEASVAPAAGTGWTEVGANAQGETIYEDANGIRSVATNGIRETEPVSMVPTRTGVVARPRATRDERFKVTAGQTPTPDEVTLRAGGQQEAPTPGNPPVQTPTERNVADAIAPAEGKGPLPVTGTAYVDEEAAINRQIDEEEARHRAIYGGVKPGETLWTKSGREITVPNFGGRGRGRARLADWLLTEARKEELPASETRWLADSVRDMDPRNLSKTDTDLLRETLFGDENGPGPENRRPPETPPAAPEGAPTPPARTPDGARTADYGANNKLVTSADAEAIRARLRAKAAQLRTGIDPEMMLDGARLAVYHIEAGTRAFADYAREMLADIGAEFRPYLRSWYESARHWPGNDARGMSTPSEIDAETARWHEEQQTLDRIGGPREITAEDRTEAEHFIDDEDDKAQVQAVGDMLAKDWTVAEIAAEPDIELSEHEIRALAQVMEERGLIPEVEADDGIQGTLPVRDEGARPEDVRGTTPVGENGTAPAGEEPGSASDAGGVAGEQAEGQVGSAFGRGPEGGGGVGEAPTDRVPDAGERAEPGATGRFADRPDKLVQGTNFSIEPGDLAEGRGPKAKARDNVSAIELAKQLIAEGRSATKAEQAILVKYTGWGGIKGAFEGTDGQFSKGFEDIGARLKAALTEEEYRTAAQSTQYAHYTAEHVVRSMWNAVRRMGFDGGLVFEPGMGTGHFVGMMPTDLAAKVKYEGIERDHLTAQIAGLLYPESGVRQADYIRTPMPQDHFDLVIGNPPFSDTVIQGDPKYAARHFMLHDYFFAKSLDSVRPGGMLAFITSSGTMNKLDSAAREYLAERAELVGGIRLNSGAFRRNANTEVTTDVLFFKRRPEGRIELEQKPAWTETVQRVLPSPKFGDTEANVSRYFSENPENVLGREIWGEGQARGAYEVEPIPGTNLASDLQAAIQRLPEDVMSPPPTMEQRAALDFASGQRKDGSFYLADDGRLMQYRDGAGREVVARGKGSGSFTAAERERITHLIPMRDALRDVFAADLARDDAAGATARTALNQHYDAFVEKFGPINKGEFTYRKPTLTQIEDARLSAREEARENSDFWDDGDFDPSAMLTNKAKVSEIAKARDAARQAAIASGRRFNEGSFDASDVQDLVTEKRPNIRPFRSDPESYRLRSIEDYNDATGEASKKKIFHESILKFEEEPEIKSAHDGVLWSMNRLGRFDVDAIAEKMGKTPDDIVAELGDLVYKVPGTKDTYQTKDEYLSGDIVSKLETAKAEAENDPDVRRNITALEGAMPPPLPPSEIDIVLGMPWIPAETVREFVRDHLNMGEPPIFHSDVTGAWHVNGERFGSAPGVQQWGTSDRDAFELLSDTMNRTPPRIYRWEGSGPDRKRVFDEVATQAAQDKVNEIKDAFSTWTMENADRADGLANGYNDALNRSVLRQFDGSYLTTPGVAATWSWRPHQTRVVARIIQDGNTYMAHAVGAGKTSAAIGAAMEMRRLGLVRKNLIIVPNHMLGQFTKEFYEQYPTARLAVADEERFHTDRRRQFVSNVAQDDLDAVIMTHSSFGKIPISDEFQGHLVQEQIDMLDQALSELPNDDRYGRGRIENQKEKLEQKLARCGEGQDQTLTFEEMGVDHLFVDESHQFRKLSLATAQGGMKGISPEGSNMAWDLYTKVRYLDSQNPGRSAVFMSGTPVTNTMGELYSLSRYMQPEALKQRGLSHFDSWAQTFGDTKTGLEETAAGTYQPVTRFGKFVNLPELYKMVGEVMDIVTPSQLEQYVTRPKLKNGQREFHLAPRTEQLDAYQADLARRMQAIKERKGPPEKGDDILLSVINDGRHAAIDPRLVEQSDNEPRSKLNVMIDNVARIYHETGDKQFYDPGSNYERESFKGPATQMIFANLGVNARGPMAFSVYNAIKDGLRRAGVDPAHIAFMGDYGSALQRQALFNDMNEGKVRVLVGSTQKMGTGVNAQRRLYALHNMDPLWFPADDEQRVGRILRQGNHNPEIEVHDYSTKGTYDSAMWKMMGNKGRFIEQFFRGDPELRNMEDIGEASMYEQASAMATTDERIITLTQMKQDLDKARRRESAHDREQYALRQKLRQHGSDAKMYQEFADGYRQDIARREDTTGDKFAMTVAGEKFTARREAERSLAEVTADRADGLGKEASTPVGQIGGFPLIMRRDSRGNLTFELRLSGGNTRGVNFNWFGSKSTHEAYLKELSTQGEEGAAKAKGAMQGAHGLVASAESVLRGFEERVANYDRVVGENLQAAENIRPLIGKEFMGGEEIARLGNAVRDLENQLKREAAEKAKPPTEQQMSELEQRASATIQGRIRIAPGEVRSVITLARTANASTFMHETSHDWLKQLLMDAGHALAPESLRQDAATVRSWLKRPENWTGFKRDGSPDVVPQERFARAFEQYLREGHAPSRNLDGVFARFKSWLTTIYRTLRGLGAPISDDIRGVFDRMLAFEPERITTGETSERPPSIANIHEADAVETTPEEAETVSDRIASERARTAATPPPDIAHEIAATTAAQPGTEAPGGPAGPTEVGGPGSQPGPIAESGGVGERPGAVGGGGGEAPAEGPRPPTGGGKPGSNEPNGRPGAGPATGVEQLAPRPAESFTGTESKLVDPAGNIRVENLTDVDSIAQAIHDSAERNDDFKSVRGGMTKGQMMDLANAMGLDPGKLDEAALGRLFGGTEDLGVKILAARKLVVQSADIVSGLMKTAAESGLDHDTAAMGVAIARHDLIQSVLSGVTAEWGRAGNAFHSLLTGWDKAQDLNQLLKDNLGRDLYQLQVIAKLGARLDTPGKISKMLRDARNRSFGGMLLEYWINGLISGPTTHATYVVGNALLTAHKAGPETLAAAAIGALRSRAGREGERVRFGEVGAQFRAGLREAPQAAQAAIEALRTGATTQLPGEDARPFLPFQGDTSLTIGRALTNDQVTWKEVRGDTYALIQGMRDGIVAIGEVTKAAPAGASAIRAEWSPQGQIPDIGIRGGVIPLGTLARLPSRGVASIHSGFRAMNYSMEINALAYRMASEEGLEGVSHTALTAALRQNPTEEMMERARGRATDLTLMGQGGKLTRNLSAFFNKTYDLPVLGETALLKFIDPFVHIAGNIMNQALMQRTPIGLFSPEIRADFTGKNGNVAQDTAMAKMLVGTSLALTVGGLAAQGLVSGSGPADPRKAAMWRLAGNQAHSVRVGDIWYDVHRLGPLGMLMSVSADMYDVAHQIGTEDADVVGKSLMHAFTQNILDESFMRGPSDLIKAVTDPDRYGSGYVRNFLVSFMPYSVGMAQMARASDPYSRQARTIMDTIRAHTPGMSESLFPRRDIWGEPMPNRDALGAPGITAIYAQRMSADPVNQAMVALGIAPAPVERHIRNIPLTDEQYDDYARIAGRMSKMRLDQFVRSPEWGSLAPADKHTWIEAELKMSREVASAQVATKYGIYRLAAQQLQTKRTAEPVPIH